MWGNLARANLKSIRCGNQQLAKNNLTATVVTVCGALQGSFLCGVLGRQVRQMKVCDTASELKVFIRIVLKNVHLL